MHDKKVEDAAFFTGSASPRGALPAGSAAGWHPPGGVVHIGKLRKCPFTILPMCDMAPGALSVTLDIPRLAYT